MKSLAVDFVAFLGVALVAALLTAGVAHRGTCEHHTAAVAQAKAQP